MANTQATVPSKPILMPHQSNFVIWSLGSFAFSIALRFASSLTLSRLLYPEAFGTAAFVQLCLVGLTLLSDVGMHLAILRAPTPIQPHYCNAVWTMQVLRGFCIGSTIAVCGSFGSHVFDKTEYVWLFPAIGLTAVIDGFTSTRLLEADRSLAARPVALIGAGSSIFGLLVSCLHAWASPSPWALLTGGMATSVARCIASHLTLPGIRNRFVFDIDVMRGVFRPGKWIMVSSTLAFLAGEGTRLLVGGLVNAAEFGRFMLASNLAGIAWQFIGHASERILLPLYARVVHQGHESLLHEMDRRRPVFLLAIWSIGLVMYAFGPEIIHLLYDPRWAKAGAILSVLGLSVMTGAPAAAYAAILPALNRTKRDASMVAFQVVALPSMMLIGHDLFGDMGIYYAFAVYGALRYCVVIAVFKPLGLMRWTADIVAMCATGVAILAVQAW